MEKVTLKELITAAVEGKKFNATAAMDYDTRKSKGVESEWYVEWVNEPTHEEVADGNSNS